jgi:hypothetical protein
MKGGNGKDANSRDIVPLSDSRFNGDFWKHGEGTWYSHYKFDGTNKVIYSYNYYHYIYDIETSTYEYEKS